MKIAVTGANGYIGQSFKMRLLRLAELGLREIVLIGFFTILQ
jgi:malate/lactate dehydrogenase